MHDIRYDEIHDELIVTNPFAQAILTFLGGAKGQEAPIRVIQGPATQLNDPQRIDVNPVHDEIFVVSGDSILVFRRQADGNEAPIRVIRSPRSRFGEASTIAVDQTSKTEIIAIAMAGGIVTYDRAASGNDVTPRSVIRGPKTGIVRIIQIQVAPKGWIVAAQPGIREQMEPEGVFVGIWHVDDNGDVPPRWKIGGPKSTLKKPRGVALNPKNKELIVADMRLNSILTYHFPEIF